MKNESKSETILSIYCLNHIAKKQSNINPTSSASYFINRADACEAAILSWNFQEVVLSKAHNVRVTSKSKSLRADQELTTRLEAIEELSDVNLMDGDPGLRLLELRGHTSPTENTAGILFFESVETVKQVFIDAKRYDFLKSRKRKFTDEFNYVVTLMRKHAETFGIPLRLDDNAFVTRDKKIGSKISNDFLDKYPTPQDALPWVETDVQFGNEEEEQAEAHFENEEEEQTEAEFENDDE